MLEETQKYRHRNTDQIVRTLNIKLGTKSTSKIREKGTIS